MRKVGTASGDRNQPTIFDRSGLASRTGLVHALPEADWAAAQRTVEYAPDTLDDERLPEEQAGEHR